MSSSNFLRIIRIFTLLAFLLTSLGTLTYFALTAIDMANQFVTAPPILKFERGAYYLLGIGVAAGALLILMVIEFWKKKPPSDKTTKILVRIIIMGLIVAVSLPSIVEYLIGNNLVKKGYSYCDVPSYSWPMYKDIYYTKDDDTCLKLNVTLKNKQPTLYPR